MREESGEQELAWSNAGRQPGLENWRVDQFHVKLWPVEKHGQFHDGDSYIVLHVSEAM